MTKTSAVHVVVAVAITLMQCDLFAASSEEKYARAQESLAKWRTTCMEDEALLLNDRGCVIGGLGEYKRSVLTKIERIVSLHLSQASRVGGKVGLSISIERDGTCTVLLPEPSGQPNLDKEILRAVQLAAPFAPLPKEASQAISRIKFDVKLVIPQVTE